MKVLLPRDLLKTAHHFPPYHIGSSLGAARFRGDYRFVGISRRRILPKDGKAAFPVFSGKAAFLFSEEIISRSLLSK